MSYQDLEISEAEFSSLFFNCVIQNTNVLLLLKSMSPKFGFI